MKLARFGDNDINLKEGNDEAKAVDSLLSRELLQLSIGDRSAMEEEIHGVRCLAVEETPELIQSSLHKLAMVLASDEIIPRNEKTEYLISQTLPRTYINDDDFRLRFLRFTRFDVVEAAKKIVRYLFLLEYLFGEQLLERPIRLNDFSKKELQFIRNGTLQFLPFRDRSGRRILVFINPRDYSPEENDAFIDQTQDVEDSDAIPREVVKKFGGKMFISGKLFLYMTWIAGHDVDTQRKGIVVIVWFDPSFAVVSTNRSGSFAHVRAKPGEIASVRVAAIHCCSPDTPVYRFITAIMRLKLGAPARLKMKAHYGESIQLLYKLQSYGIPTDHIPISFSGTIKTTYAKQWMRAREAQESTIYLDVEHDFWDIIECPRLTDVLFRQGISLVWNPGNARVRSLIEEMQSDQEEIKRRNLIRVKRREMVIEIIQQMRQTSRFLVWNDGGWWNEIRDQEQLTLKIEYLIKEVRKFKREEREQLKLNSSTSIFLNNGNNDSSDDDMQTCGKGCLN